MIEEHRMREARDNQGLRGSTNNAAIGITAAILGIMAVAIAIDFSSVPMLALLALLVLGSTIAALVVWG